MTKYFPERRIGYMEYQSVEAIFNEAVIEDLEEEALDASEYGDIIDQMAGLDDIDDSLKSVTDGTPTVMVNSLIGDKDVIEKINRIDTECDEYPDFDEEDYYEEEIDDE
jgi:hypothetical protein